MFYFQCKYWLNSLNFAQYHVKKHSRNARNIFFENDAESWLMWITHWFWFVVSMNVPREFWGCEEVLCYWSDVLRLPEAFPHTICWTFWAIWRANEASDLNFCCKSFVFTCRPQLLIEPSFIQLQNIVFRSEWACRLRAFLAREGWSTE